MHTIESPSHPIGSPLDGVKVAPQTRTAEYYGQGSDADDTYKKFHVVENVESGIANAFVDDAQQENMLVLMNSYFANGAPINPVDEPVQGQYRHRSRRRNALHRCSGEQCGSARLYRR